MPRSKLIPRTHRRRIFAILTVGLAGLVGLATSEIVLRVLAVGPRGAVVEGLRLSSDPVLVYELAPGATVLEDETPVNSAGLRDREYARVKTADTFRIGLVGDSVVYGYGVRQTDTMARALERMLAESNIGSFEVLNFGVSGYNSRQLARRVETAVSDFAPDLVVYLYTLNDPDDFDNDLYGLLGTLKDNERRSFESLVRHADSMLFRSHVYRLFVSTLDSLRHAGEMGLPRVKSPAGPPDYILGLHQDGPRWTRTHKDLQRMGAAVRRLPAPWVAAVSPYLWKADDDRQVKFDPRLRATTAKVAEALRASGASVLDLSQPVARFTHTTGQWLGIDEVHYSATGHKFVAVALLDYLLRQSLLPGVSVHRVADLKLADTGLVPMIAALDEERPGVAPARSSPLPWRYRNGVLKRDEK